MPKSNNELWKPISGYEGYYEVSNFGKVKSLSRVVKAVSHNKIITRKTPEKCLKPILTGKDNAYLTVTLCKEGKCKPILLHRLVAEAFLPNPDNLPCVNHKDENPKNNCVDNLEWCTYAYNNSYGTRNERISKSSKGKPGMVGQLNPNYGKHPTIETRIKMSESAKRRFRNATF